MVYEGNARKVQDMMTASSKHRPHISRLGSSDVLLEAGDGHISQTLARFRKVSVEVHAERDSSAAFINQSITCRGATFYNI